MLMYRSAIRRRGRVGLTADEIDNARDEAKAPLQDVDGHTPPVRRSHDLEVP